VTSFLPAGPDSAEALNWFRKRLFYERGDFADANTFTKLEQRLAALDTEQHTEGNYLFYLATAPKFFAQIVQQLGTSALSRQENGRWRRVVIVEPRHQESAAGKPDLPHRSLSGQRDGAEHHGLPFR
jgi:glucose-6-phosphate 1-dehydrogenase